MPVPLIKPITRLVRAPNNRRFRAAGLLLLGMACAPAVFAQNVPAERYQQRSDHAGQAAADGRVTFQGSAITIPVIAVEPGKPDTRFEIHGQVDPTVVVPANTRIRFTLSNMDGGMAHGLDVTRQSPPYATATGLPLNPASNDRDEPHSVLALTGTVPAHSAAKSNLAVRHTGWFRLEPGHYFYVCPVPGHAHKGMYGRIIAR